MPVSFTLDEAVAIRATTLAAYKRALNSAEYRIGSRHARHQDIHHLRQELEHWDYMVSYLSGKGTGDSVRRAVPIDR